MLLRLVLLFTVVPLVDLCLLLQAARWLGSAGTLAIVLMTGMLGATVVFRQGRRSLAQAVEQLRRGTLPAAAMGDALMIALAAVLLITPGLMTDLAGVVLLVPAARRAAFAVFERLGRRWLSARAHSVATPPGQGTARAHGAGGGDPSGQRRTVVDVSFRRCERVG